MMEEDTIRLAADLFKISSYPRWVDRTLWVHVSSALPIITTQSIDGVHDQNTVPSETENREVGEQEEETFSVAVNSVVLSNESEFFQRLFSSGFREALAPVVDIYITSKEKEAFQYLLQCMDNKDMIGLTDAEPILTLWNLCERFMVSRCSSHCIDRLRSASLSLDQCIRIIEFSSSSKKCEMLKDLIEVCARSLADHFKSLSFLNPDENDQEYKILLTELKELPSSSMEALFSSDYLAVEREEVAFYAMIVWVKQNASTKYEEEEFVTRMAACIRFPFMKAEVLSTLTEVSEMQNPICQQLLVEGLKFKAAPDDLKNKYTLEASKLHKRFNRRIAYHRPLKVFSLEYPRKQATVHVCASFDEIEALNVGNFLEFESFVLAGSKFSIRIIQYSNIAHNMGKKTIGLEMVLNNTVFTRIQGELKVLLWSPRQMDFVNKFRTWYTFSPNNPILSCPIVLGREWNDYIQTIGGRKIYIYFEFLVNSLSM